MRILDIIEGTSVDGPGLRTSIYFAGCRHQCSGCHNPESWDFDGGREMTVDEVMAIVEENDFNVTFSGGDPVFQLDEIIPLAERIHAAGYTIWLYTGYTYERLLTISGIDRLLPNLEAIVDGPFIASLRDTTLHFRGSSNQRILFLSEERKEKSE